MDAITALHSRVSSSRLTEPAPAGKILENIFKAAMRAPDHALLRPWRFLVISGDSRQRLGELFVQATLAQQPDTAPEKLDKVRSKPLRAPMIVVGICSPRDHPKVPVLEQSLATGAAIQNMLVAAHAQDVGAIWRTGPMASDKIVTRGLGLADEEQILGFIYLGSIDGPRRQLKEEDFSDYFQDW